MMLANIEFKMLDSLLNGWGFYIVVGYIVLAIFAPQLLEQIKGALIGLVGTQKGTTGEATPAAMPSENLIVKRRCGELKAMFPEASPEQRLSWAERGLDIEQAGHEYQDKLMQELKELRAKVRQEK